MKYFYCACFIKVVIYIFLANVHHQTLEGMQPVHLAASLGRLKMLQDLKQYGADMNAKDSLGKTPLDRA